MKRILRYVLRTFVVANNIPIRWSLKLRRIARRSSHESEELKPCPFCGDSDVEVYGKSGAFVGCNNCGAHGQSCDATHDLPTKIWGPKQAIAAWNTRASEARVWVLEEALRNLCDSIETSGGHDENGDVFDLSEAIAALSTGSGKEQG